MLKKIRFKPSFFILAIIFSHMMNISSSLASNITFGSDFITANVEESFTLPVMIDPVGQPQYTVSMALSFPPESLEITSFVLDKNWLPLSQPGYDLLDNEGGQLIKTAGFPKGFSSPVLFGTVTFRAKSEGEKKISFDPSSFVLNGNNESTFTPISSLAVTIFDQSQSAIHKAAPQPTIAENLSEKIEEEQKEISPSSKNLFDVILEPTSAKPAYQFAYSDTLLILLFMGGISFGIVLSMVPSWIENLFLRRPLTHGKKRRK